jgi:hypothetical protein
VDGGAKDEPAVFVAMSHGRRTGRFQFGQLFGQGLDLPTQFVGGLFGRQKPEKKGFDQKGDFHFQRFWFSLDPFEKMPAAGIGQGKNVFIGFSGLEDHFLLDVSGFFELPQGGIDLIKSDPVQEHHVLGNGLEPVSGFGSGHKEAQRNEFDIHGGDPYCRMAHHNFIKIICQEYIFLKNIVLVSDNAAPGFLGVLRAFTFPEKSPVTSPQLIWKKSNFF